MASQSSQVCVVSSNSANKAIFYVTDRLLSSLNVGDSVQIKKQGSVYKGHLTKMETLPDKASGLYEAEAEFAGSDAVAKGATVSYTHLDVYKRQGLKSWQQHLIIQHGFVTNKNEES